MEEDQLEERTNGNPLTFRSSEGPTVVGIGASAGGLAALKHLFERIPSDSGLVFVVVVHLSPEHKSYLPDLLQGSVRIPVQQVTETTPLVANNVYVIPPNANLSTIDTHLRLSKLEEQRRERAPIDHFFRTLASTHDGHSIGVILTGTGSDGTLGLREIKAKGGLILVQDPNEAEFDGMPQSAIATGLVDRVLPIADIAEALLRLTQVGPRITLAGNGEDPQRKLLPKVLAILKARTDRDFSRYKTATLLRRIARRMQLNYIDNSELYLDKLREYPEETRALADDLLITVTSFFRDTEVFRRLESEVVPQLFEGKSSEDSIRIWSVGCATGEEAYSIAMLLLEEAARRDTSPKIQIFASDLHKRSLEGAREGLYPGDIQTDVTAERLKRFFHRENGGYRIAKDVRDLVVFAPHNLLGDPPFSRLDLVTCRNLLIYLDRSVQRDVIDLFHYSLCPNGYLLLGSAETIDASELFRIEDKKLCIYRKRNVPAPEPRLPVFPLTRLPAVGEVLPKREAVPAATPYQLVHQKFLERYAPPSILVSQDNRLVHLSESAGRYLIHPGGEATLSVLKLVREELRIELQSSLQSARKSREFVDSAPIPVRFDGHTAPVVMHVRPAQDGDEDAFALVIFEEHQPRKNEASTDDSRSDIAIEPGQQGTRLAELEAELNMTRQRLQINIEEYETSREEMKAANEEMQSTNEELRSTMEELETSKEELQSINEELQTVNQENRHKVEELSQLSSDLQNLLSATDIATLFLDRDLRIMRFTPRLAELFNARVTDRGRPISDLTHRLGYSQLREDAEAVLSRLIPIEREIRDDQGRWYLTNVRPYRSTEDRIEGVVITFVDITARKTAEAALRDGEERYRLLFQASPAPFLIIKPDAPRFTIIEVNDAYLAATMRTREEVIGRGVFDAFPDNPDDAAIAGVNTLRASIERVLASRQPDRLPGLKYDIARPDGTFEERWWSPVNSPVLDEKGEVKAIIHNANDVTEEHRAAEGLRESEERYHALFAASPVPFMVLAPNPPDFTIIAANDAYLAATLTTRGSLIGRRLFDVFTDDQTRPDAHGPDDLNASLARVLSSRRPDAMPRTRYDIKTPHGKFETRWWLAINAPVLDATGQVSAIIHQVTNETELQRTETALQESEARFRLFVENVQEYALVQTDPAGLITSWNPGAERLFGYGPEQVLGQNFATLLTPEDEKAGVFREELSKVTSGQRNEDARWFVRKEGSRFWARWITEPIRDENGQFRGLAKIMRDETEREQAETFTKHSLAEKEELLKEVHHRVKNNLQVIVSLLNMQVFQIHDEQVLALFQEARNRVLAISSIHELLYRAESFASIKLIEYANQLVPGLVRFYGLDRRVAVHIQGDGATLELERAVPYGMLLNELVSNACKHAFPAPVTGSLTISLWPVDDAIVLTVADTGPGLPDGFDYKKATSLGLKLVHGLASQLGGVIEISSKPGTTVRVRFPAARMERDE